MFHVGFLQRTASKNVFAVFFFFFFFFRLLDLSEEWFLTKKIEIHHLMNLSRGGTPYKGLYWEAPPKRGNLFKLAVYKRVGI